MGASLLALAKSIYYKLNFIQALINKTFNLPGQKTFESVLWWSSLKTFRAMTD